MSQKFTKQEGICPVENTNNIGNAEPAYEKNFCREGEARPEEGLFAGAKRSFL